MTQDEDEEVIAEVIPGGEGERVTVEVRQRTGKKVEVEVEIVAEAGTGKGIIGKEVEVEIGGVGIETKKEVAAEIEGVVAKVPKEKVGVVVEEAEVGVMIGSVVGAKIGRVVVEVMIREVEVVAKIGGVVVKDELEVKVKRMQRRTVEGAVVSVEVKIGRVKARSGTTAVLRETPVLVVVWMVNGVDREVRTEKRMIEKGVPLLMEITNPSELVQAVPIMRLAMIQTLNNFFIVLYITLLCILN